MAMPFGEQTARTVVGLTVFAVALWLPLNGAGGQEKPAARPPGPAMQKQVTKQANFVVYVPKGWSCEEASEQGFRTLAVRDPERKYEVAMSCGNDPAGGDVKALARHLIGRIGKQFPDLSLANSMAGRDGKSLVFDGRYSAPARGKREFRCWVSSGDGSFACSRIEAPEGELAAQRALLLTILANVRVTKGAFRFKGPPPVEVQFARHRLRDGSASFQVPQNWRVQDLGAGQFIASDPTGSFSFIAAGANVLTPQLGVRVPGALVSPFLRPHKAMEFVATSQGIARNMRFVEVNARDDLARQMAQVYTAGPVIVEDFLYTCVTQAGRAKAYTLGISFGSRIGTNWIFRHLTVGAPEDKFDAFAANFVTMFQSYAIDDKWVKDYVARGAARLRELQRQTSALVARNAQEIRQTMQAAYEERRRSWDYIDYQRTNYIRGQGDWISDLEGGTVYRTDSWGIKNLDTGEYWEGTAYDYVHFKGENPKYREQMVPVDSRQLWERHVRNR